MSIILICLFNGVSAYSDIFLGKSIIFKTAEGGPIMFDVDITISGLDFENNYLMIINANNIYNKIGFSCPTENANITITKICSMEIHYTVNAPTYTLSVTKIYVGNKGKPLDVSGDFSWSYNSNLKIVTVNVLHQSPSNIILEWADNDNEYVDDFTKSIYKSLELLGSILTIMSLTLLVGALTGRFEVKGAIEFVITCMVLAIVFSIFVTIL